LGTPTLIKVTLDFPLLDNGDESILKNDEYKNDVKYGFDAFLAVHYKFYRQVHF
jgi:hypothetical protein